MNQKEVKLRFVYEFKPQKNSTFVEIYKMLPRTYEYIGAFKKVGIEMPSLKEYDFFWEIHNFLSCADQKKYFDFFEQKHHLLHKFPRN